ncbi:TcfC E-set like domain-containing protein [Sphingomonas sp. PR090111-T3T-6A]|uniref:TcfC E-set like domain-containing protein n=1 Tax=Sphingomonas sp. PR090111-T3T-6A TaxID=685778 RepID=UPI0003796B5D|nr:TcfC E-set like domain-containing protein [Sphingomonas sp. PR090111-T3T-6A]
MKPVPSHSVSPRALRRSLLIAGVALPALAAHAAEAASPARGPMVAVLGQTDRAQMNTQPKDLQLQTKAPAGFEDIGTKVSTLFDLSFQGRHIGSFSATYDNGSFQFADPARVAAAIGGDVDVDKVKALLSQPLPGNEQYRCRPGDLATATCGALPVGQSGVVVTPENFSVSLFLARDYFHLIVPTARVLGPPVSGPSLIQGARMSVAAESGQVRYGGTFDTLASIGRTALVAQTVLSDDQGFRAQELYAQRIWSDRRVAAGLLQDLNLLTFTSYRIAGAEFGSFYGTYLDSANDLASPLQVVLPQRAQVEVYRDNVLIFTGQYSAGLATIDTRSFPNGSYNVHIVARDGGSVILDENRNYTKLAGLPPPGKIAFDIRVGERTSDNFEDDGLGSTPSHPFFPRLTGEFAATASAQTRVGHSFAVGEKVLAFNSDIYAETSLEVFRGKMQAVIAGGVGSHGTYSGLVSGTLTFEKTSFNISARSTHTDRTLLDDAGGFDLKKYRPFFRNEDSIFVSAQRKLFGGTLSLSGGYTRSQDLPNRYTYSAQYTRPIVLPLVGTALMTMQGSVSDIDRRVSIGFSFYRQVDRRTTAAFNMGGEVAHGDDGSLRSGFSPVALGTLTRTQQIGATDVTAQVGGSTDADSDRLFGTARAEAALGEVDATAQYQHQANGGGDTSVLLNAQSGFVIGGGSVKLGLRNPSDAIVLLDIKSDKGTGASTPDAAAPPADRHGDPVVSEGGYRVTVDDRPGEFVRAGQRIAVGLPSLASYQIGLKPENAPPFDIDAATRTVPLYPGNVARLEFKAREIVSLFGQAVDAHGKPIANARVEAGTDFAIADDHGYFTVTAPRGEAMTVKTPSGGACLNKRIDDVIGKEQYGLIYRVGAVACNQ